MALSTYLYMFTYINMLNTYIFFVNQAIKQLIDVGARIVFMLRITRHPPTNWYSHQTVTDLYMHVCIDCSPTQIHTHTGLMAIFQGTLCKPVCLSDPCWDRSLLRPYGGPVRLPRERKGIGRCVRCVLTTCGKGRLSRSKQLVGYFYSMPF